MPRVLRTLLRHTLFRPRDNLISRDDPYALMAHLLRGLEVVGILDAGASDGRTSRKLLRSFPQAKAYLFEPHPDYASTLNKLAAANPRIKPQEWAFSDRSGHTDLVVTRARGQTSLLRQNRRNQRINPEGSTIEQTANVPVTTLDTWSAQHNDPPIQVLKFDIQAGELRALHGAHRVLEHSALLVYTEVFFNPMYEGGALSSQIDL